MGSHTALNQKSRLRRSVRTSLVVCAAITALFLALALLERSGPSPVHPLLQNASSTKLATLSSDRSPPEGASTLGATDGDKTSDNPPSIPNLDHTPTKHCRDHPDDQGNGHDHGKGYDFNDCRPPSGRR